MIRVSGIDNLSTNLLTIVELLMRLKMIFIIRWIRKARLLGIRNMFGRIIMEVNF